MSNPNPIGGGEPQKEPSEVTRFRRDYADAISHAQTSAEHTATEGWQNLYGNHQESIQRGRKDICDRMAGILEPMRLHALDG